MGPHATGAPPDRLALRELPQHVAFVQSQLALSERGQARGAGAGAASPPQCDGSEIYTVTSGGG